MIESIQFTNYKALRKTTLPLQPFTLLLGPNGSGKTSVLQALRAIADIAAPQAGFQRQDGSQSGMGGAPVLSVTAPEGATGVEIALRLRLNKQVVVARFRWPQASRQQLDQFTAEDGNKIPQQDAVLVARWLGQMQIYTLDHSAIAQPVAVNSGARLQYNGGGLAAVLDDLKDNYPEQWDALLSRDVSMASGVRPHPVREAFAGSQGNCITHEKRGASDPGEGIVTGNVGGPCSPNSGLPP